MDGDRRVEAVYFSCPKFTVGLVVQDGIIVESAPFTKRFVGQPLASLALWAKKRFGPIRIERWEKE